MRMLNIRIALILSLIFLASPTLTSPHQDGFQFNRNRRFVSVPVEIRNNLVVVPLYINGFGPFYFILDTGVNTTLLIEPMISHLLDLQPKETVLVFGLGGEGVVEAVRTEGVKLSMTGITGHNIDLIVIPPGVLSFSEIFGFPIYGVLGYDFFRNFPVEIDYAAQTMRVFRQSDYRVSRRSHTIPVQLVDGKPYVESLVEGTRGDTLITRLLVDLGASHPIYLNREYQYLSENTLYSYLGKGISGNLMGKIGRLNALNFGEISIANPLAAYPDGEFLVFQGRQIQWEGIIGGGILKRFNVIIDYPSRQIVLTPGSDRDEPFSTNLSGMEVIATGPDLNNYRVHYVRPGSASYEAGVMSGDQIIEINRRIHHRLSLDEITDPLSGDEGDLIHIVLLRGNDLIYTIFRLREDMLY